MLSELTAKDFLIIYKHSNKINKEKYLIFKYITEKKK